MKAPPSRYRGVHADSEQFARLEDQARRGIARRCGNSGGRPARAAARVSDQRVAGGGRSVFSSRRRRRAAWKPFPVGSTSATTSSRARPPMLAIRYPSGALTFHRPVDHQSRRRGPSQVRFQVASVRLRRPAAWSAGPSRRSSSRLGRRRRTRCQPLLPAWPRRSRRRLEQAGTTEGWLKLSKEGLAAGALESAGPVSPNRSLLFIHGTFSNAASAYRRPRHYGFLRAREGFV